MSGRYVHVRSKASDFLVAGFVHPDELAEIRAYLPDTDLPQTLEDKLQDIEESVPRHIGRPLLQKMYKFWREAQTVFQTAANLLDNAHNILALPNKFRYCNLHELAEELLSSIISKGPDGKFSAPALFAVHQSLTAEDSGIRIELYGSLRSTIYYEISSIREMQNNVRVVEEIQKYRNDILTGKQDSLLHAFAEKAGKLVDMSRQTRKVTSHGTLGPSSKKSTADSDFRHGTVNEEFNPAEEIFSLFIESWTGLTTFSPSSSLNGIGSTILRAVDRYQDQTLDQSTGWTFLQEIGYIPPWQTVAPFTLRVPFTGRRLRVERLASARGYTPDQLSAIRKPWHDLTVFCIDDVTAMEIDDGVSLERTANPNEYWVHVHIADPASHLDPRGDAAVVARAYTENVYMQDRVVTMLNTELVESKLSLAPNTPCLTFSAKMNLEGDILDTTVVAGRIEKVVYMTPSLFNQFGEGYSKTDRITRTVGRGLSAQTGLPRPMTAEKDLSEDQIMSLRTLQLLGKARSNKMKMKGAVSYSTPSPDVSVSFGGSRWMKQSKGNASRLYFGDPSIQVTVPIETDPERYNSLHNNGGVAPLMLIANEVAARWCQARGIPIPYRTTQPDPEKNPLDYFKNKLLPAIQETGNAPLEDIINYVGLIGKARPSTTPGPHMTLAADVIAKATSPLRRYGDLLLHWQVSAALLQEATTGTSLVGNTDQSFLPFSQDDLEKIIPRLDIRERAIRQCHNRSTRAWLCHFLLRAWKFGEAELPSPMRFSIADMSKIGTMGSGNMLMGQLMDFAVRVKMECPEWEVKADLKAGDEFEVELQDVNPYSGTIVVKALRRWGDDVQNVSKD